MENEKAGLLIGLAFSLLYYPATQKGKQTF